jgi:glycosyltransferase involved in cell wall biosynthesis
MDVTLIDDSITFDGYSPSSQPLGGAEKAFASLPGALARRGHDVTVINRSRYQLNVDGATWLHWEAPRPATTQVLIAFRKPELLEALPAGQHLLWLASPAGYLEKPAHREVLARLAPTLVFMGRVHAATWGRGIDLAHAVIEPGVRADYLEAADGDPETPPYAVITTHPRRGLAELLDAWVDHIRPAVPEARLRIYSTALDRGRLGGAVAPRLRPVLERAMGAPGVDIVRPQADPEMAEAYAGARVHLYPGMDSEIYCSTLAESQACGVPAVARPGGAVAERIVDGRTGYVVPDAEALANVTILLFSDDSTYNQLKCEARAVQRQRTWDAAAAEFEALCT